MIEFKVQKKSKKSKARLGILKTKHGIVETPCLVPVATQAVVKTLDSKEVKETGSQILIANTFHLHLRPGEELIKKSGGLHNFMNWQGPLMTDSGGFQVFSLGFGRDFKINKILKQSIGGKESVLTKVLSGNQPKLLKITEDGVYFKSLIDGSDLFLGPKESIKIQEKLGADIIFAFDECPPPNASYEYIKNSLEKTHKWAKTCQKERKTKQSLFGIVQGGKYSDLRIESAKYISSLDFDGYGIGGEFGGDKKNMTGILNKSISFLQEKKPRHLLGIGRLEDIGLIINQGIDTFDCTIPTHYARRGIAFIGNKSEQSLDLNKKKFLLDKNPLDKKCKCFVCQNYKRNYICHLLRAKEITALKLLTFHNLYFFNNFVNKIRQDIKQGKF